MGSKRAIWKYLAPIVLKDRRKDQHYIEPFCGGCNSICQVSGNRIASDINPYLIAMFKGLLNNEKVAIQIDKEYYDKVRTSYRNNDDNYSDFEKGWVGFMASYSGRFFDGGYSGNNVAGKEGIRNYIGEAIQNIYGQIEYLHGIEFHCCSYENLPIPENSIIYCDPPYKDTKKYDRIDFNYDNFYQWCFDMKCKGHQVFISEYDMPSDFTLLWEKEIKCNIDLKKGTRIERLYKA